MAFAQAIHTFSSDREGDLTFEQNDLLHVLEKDESGWWVGQSEDGRKGDFPGNYVEIISAKEYQRIKAGRKLPLLATLDSSYLGRVTTVTVKSIPEKSGFVVEAILTKKRARAVKSMTDFRTLDSQVKFLFPDFKSILPPVWADKVIETNQASTRKAAVLGRFLNKLIGMADETSEYALVKWIAPRDRFSCSSVVEDSVHHAQVSVPDSNSDIKSVDEEFAGSMLLAKSEYEWKTDDAAELSLYRGALISILSKETSSPGWWEGETSDGQKGLFPMNYVIELSDEETRDVLLGKKHVKIIKVNWRNGKVVQY